VAKKFRSKTDLYSRSVRLKGVKMSKGKLIVKYDGLAPVSKRDEISSPYQDFEEEYEKTEDNDFIGFLNDEEPDNPIL